MNASPKWRRLLALSGMALLVLIALGLRHNFLLGVGAILSLSLIWVLVARHGESLILTYVVVFQWLEASLGIYYANFLDTPLLDEQRFATALLLIGLVIQALGVRLAAGPVRAEYRSTAEAQICGFPQGTWLKFYVIASVIAVIALVSATALPQLSQPLLVLPFLRWAAYVILTFASLYGRDSNRTLWFAVFCFELLFSIGDYFSSFKFVFVFTFLGVALAQPKFSIRAKVGLGVVVLAAILFGAVWSEIKGEYRNFVSGGEQAQIVTVAYPERLAKIWELVSQMDLSALEDGFDKLFRRIEYAEYFSDVTTNVPDVIPYADGELWADALMRPLMPRLFFPDKAIIDESELTSAYTGRNVAGFGEGTQISLGYIAESYIDFGPYGMMIVMFALGITQGWLYRWLMYGKYSRGVLGTGLVCAIFATSSGSIGTSSAKLVGSFVVSVLVIWLLVRFVIPNTRLRRLNDLGGSSQPRSPTLEKA